MTRPGGWAHLEESAPEIADAVRKVIERGGFMFLGTIRRDGAPRISPAETHLVDGHLALALIRSWKATDILRDPRITLQSPVADATDPGTEVKIRGRMDLVEDAELRQRIVDAIEERSGWRPRKSWLLVTVAIEAIALLEWRKGDMALMPWDPQRGVRESLVLRLDMEAGRYVSRD